MLHKHLCSWLMILNIITPLTIFILCCIYMWTQFLFYMLIHKLLYGIVEEGNGYTHYIIIIIICVINNKIKFSKIPYTQADKHLSIFVWNFRKNLPLLLITCGISRLHVNVLHYIA